MHEAQCEREMQEESGKPVSISTCLEGVPKTLKIKFICLMSRRRHIEHEHCMGIASHNHLQGTRVSGRVARPKCSPQTTHQLCTCTRDMNQWSMHNQMKVTLV